MKYNIIAVILLSLMLTACGRRDAKIQHDLVGTWDVDLGQNFHSTTVIHSDGTFEAQVSGYTNGEIVKIEGTFRAKDGDLVDTVTKSSMTNRPVPYVLHGHLISIDDHECVMKWDGATNETHSRKVTQ